MASRRCATFLAKSTTSSSAGLLPTTPLKAKAEELKLSPFGDLPPQALVGLALKEWAANAGTIDNLSITPDLLGKVVSYISEARD